MSCFDHDRQHKLSNGRVVPFKRFVAILVSFARFTIMIKSFPCFSASSDSDVNCDFSDDSSDKDKPFFVMLHSPLSEPEFNAIFSDGSDKVISFSSDDDDVLLDALLERRVVQWKVHGLLLEDVFNSTVDHNLHWSNLPINTRFSKWMNAVRMTKVVFSELLYIVLRSTCHLQGSLQDLALIILLWLLLCASQAIVSYAFFSRALSYTSGLVWAMRRSSNFRKLGFC